jgi:hypothetical protein
MGFEYAESRFRKSVFGVQGAGGAVDWNHEGHEDH